MVPSVVVFDLGQVLLGWEPERAFVKGLGEEGATAFLDVHLQDFLAINERMDGGQDLDEAASDLLAAQPDSRTALQAYLDNFHESITGVIEGTEQIVRDLYAAGVPLYALTNFGVSYDATAARFDVFECFADVVVSWKEGVAKPDPRIFAILAERLGRPLSEAVFIDDNAANVEVARACGLDTIHFLTPEQSRAELRARGLPL